jgi:hypothetical protein
MKHIPTLRSLVIIGLLFITASAFADDNRGRVMYIRGSVTATDGTTGVPRILRADSRVRLGEVIETGPKSVVQIVFPDRSMLHVKSDSKIKVEAYNFTSAKPEDDDMVVSIVKGGMRSLTGLVGKRNPEQVRYKTPVATIGIRGTILEISQTKSGSFQTIFDYGGGYVLTANETKLLLGAGEAGEVSADGTNNSKIPSPRTENDPALLAAKLAGSTQEQVIGSTGDICQELGADQILLMVAIKQAVPGTEADNLASTVQGLTSCLPVEIAATMLSTTSYIDPDGAPELFNSAIKGGVNVAIAMESVLRGMSNATPDKIQSVVRSAVNDHGLNAKDANNILNNLLEDSACRY